MAPQYIQAPPAEQAEARQLEPRSRRLLLSAAGLVAVAGLGALAAFFTAPFADPPGNGTGVPTSIVPPSAAKPMDKPSLSGTTASEALRQLTKQARQHATPPSENQPRAEALAADDPRWAKADTPATREDKPASAPLAGASDHPNPLENTATAGTAEGSAQESLAAPVEQQSPTGAAPPPDFPTGPADQAPLSGPPEPADETATAAISPAETANEPAETTPGQEPAESGAAPSSNVTVTTDVKMRAGPRDEAAVLTVIPDNAVVGLVKCESWCEVVYKGRRGFVYKGFIDGRGVAVRRPQERAQAQQPQAKAPAQAPAEQKPPQGETPKAIDLNSIGR